MSHRIKWILLCIGVIIACSLFSYNVYFFIHPSLSGNAANACTSNCGSASAVSSPISTPKVTPTAAVHIPEVPGYTLAWNDEFTGPELDNSKWFAVNSRGGDEQQGCCLNYTYSSLISPEQLRVHDGMLSILTERNTTDGKAYKTGAITTETKSDNPTFTYLYGRIDIRARLPRGNGVLPAIWLLTGPATEQVSYEIDIMEMLGEDPHTIYMVDHYGGGRLYCQDTGVDYSQDFHVFSFDWTPDKMTWSVDGQVLCSKTSHIPNKPMYLIINTALSDGAWGDKVNGATPLPQSFDIDYVRVYKQN